MKNSTTRTLALEDVKVYVTTQITYVCLWHDDTEETISKLAQLLILEDMLLGTNKASETGYDGDYEEFRQECLKDIGNQKGFDPNLTEDEYKLCSYYLDVVENVMRTNDDYFKDSDYFQQYLDGAKSMFR